MFDDGVNYFGSQNSQLTISNLNAATNNGTYYVQATSSTGMVLTSSNATLNVVSFTPYFMPNPVGTTNLWVGDSWSMSASVIYDTGSMFGYQWTLNGNPLSDGTSSTGYTISGSTTPNLTLTDLDPVATGDYRLVFNYTNAVSSYRFSHQHFGAFADQRFGN